MMSDKVEVWLELLQAGPSDMEIARLIVGAMRGGSTDTLAILAMMTAVRLQEAEKTPKDAE
jgi:hypothetical protein